MYQVSYMYIFPSSDAWCMHVCVHTSVILWLLQLFGLPGLLCTISQSSTDERAPLELYGPVGLRKFVRTSLNLSRSILRFQITIHELCHDRQPEEIDGIVSGLVFMAKLCNYIM